MNLQELEYTRIELRRALADLSGSTKGQLQAFSEHPPADKNKYPRHHPVKWFTEFGHLNRGDMLTSEQHRCHNEKKKFQRRV